MPPALVPLLLPSSGEDNPDENDPNHNGHNGHGGSAGGIDKGAEMAATLSTTAGRESLMLLADALHMQAVTHHKNHRTAKALDCYSYAARLADMGVAASRRAKAPEGAGQALASGEALIAQIRLNSGNASCVKRGQPVGSECCQPSAHPRSPPPAAGKLRWSEGDTRDAEIDFFAAAAAFDRALKHGSKHSAEAQAGGGDKVRVYTLQPQGMGGESEKEVGLRGRNRAEG